MDFIGEFKKRVKRIKTDSEKKVIEPAPVIEQLGERWKIYYFTLPPRFIKVVATGFETKSEAYKFIEKRLKIDKKGEKVQKVFQDDTGQEYMVFYEAALEDMNIEDPYVNPPEITTVGNDKDAALIRWNE